MAAQRKSGNKQPEEKARLYTRIPSAAAAAFFVLFTAAAIPLTSAVTGDALYYVPGNGQLTDIFILFREIAFFVFCMGLLVFFIGENVFMRGKTLKPPSITDRYFRLPLCAAGLYLLMAVISSVFSRHPEVCFFGFPTEHEGLAAVIGYVLIFAAACVYLKNADKRRFLCVTVFGAAILIALMAGAELMFGPLSSAMFGAEQISGGSALLFGNATLCGQVCTLLAPAALALSLSERESRRFAVFSLLTGVLMAQTVRTASASAFYLTVIAAAVTLLFAVKRTGVKRSSVCILIALIPSAVLALSAPQAFSSLIASGVSNSGSYSAQSAFPLTNIETRGNTLLIESKDMRLELVLDDGSAALFRDGREVAMTADGDISTPAEPDLGMIHIECGNGLLVLDLGHTDPVFFQVKGDTFRYIGLNGYLDDIVKPAFPELSDFYGFATGRGYIWLSTVPMLKDCIFKGVGAGQFAFYYPQNDVVGSLTTHGTSAILTDKPHCMYLQIFALYGLPALAAFCVLGVSLVRSGIACIKKRDTAAVGVALSVAVYLAGGVVNDSCVVSAAWFWLFAGVLTAYAAGNREQQRKP